MIFLRKKENDFSQGFDCDSDFFLLYFLDSNYYIQGNQSVSRKLMILFDVVYYLI